MLTFKVYESVFPLAEVFTISRGSRTEARVVTVEVESKGFRGWGECVPYPRYGETVEGVIADIKGFLAGNPEHRRKGLQEAMAPGAVSGLDSPDGSIADVLLVNNEGRTGFGVTAAELDDPGPVVTALGTLAAHTTSTAS